MEHNKYHSLDSLRGIAALFVLFGHYLISPIAPWFFFRASYEAVILFFILSGFVLSVMLSRHKLSYRNYLFRRCLRIYPVYFVSIVLVLISYQLIIALGYTIIPDIDYKTIGINLPLILTAFNPYNEPVWSLYHEMIVSIIFPLLFLLANKKSFLWLSIFTGIIFSFGSITHHYYSQISIMSVPYYSSFFMLGIIIHKYQNWFINKTSIYVLIIGIVLYFCRFISFGLVSSEALRNIFVAIGSVIIIYHALYMHSFAKILHNKYLRFLGLISYPIYLLHMPLFNFLNAIIPSKSNLTAFIISLGAILLAFLVNKIIEQPLIRLSRK